MAANLATKEEFTVGWGFYLNNKNTVASQNSSGSENLTDPKMVLTPLTTLTTAPQGTETLVLSGFQGGGGATRKTRSTSAFQTHEVCSYIRKPLKKCSQRLLRHPAADCEQRHEREARELTPKRKRSVFVGGGTVPFIASNPAQPEPTKITALRDLKQKFDTS